MYDLSVAYQQQLEALRRYDGLNAVVTAELEADLGKARDALWIAWLTRGGSA